MTIFKRKNKTIDLADGLEIREIKREYRNGILGWLVTQEKPLLSNAHTGFLTTRELIFVLKGKIKQ